MAYIQVYVSVAVFLVINVSAMDISLSNSGRAVRGSKVTFTAIVSGYKGENLQFRFHDSATPQHSTTIEKASNITTWEVEYPKSLYEKGDYTAYVGLWKEYFGEWWRITSANNNFQLTDTLNGNFVLNQNNEDLKNSFVAVNKTVYHYIKLPDYELEFLKRNSSEISTYWFIDCVPYGSFDNFSFNYTYEDNMSEHQVEAIIIANNEPLPPITTTTTTTTSTTTTTTSTTTTTPKPSPPPATEVPTTLPPSTTRATTQEATNETMLGPKLEAANKTRVKRSASSNLTCNNNVPIGKKYTYGRYEMKVSVREPISTINITGINWLQHGDLLNLEVKYTGSPPFEYCIYYKLGQYNVTGNETCATKTRTTSNKFPLVHYFSDSEQHTVLVIIENEIGKTVSRAIINIYKTSVHAQLSVIVVPVFFCLVAVILVVFGIAYYQHRSRHTVEVADFDFGQAHPDFKTFRERLRDSFRNAFNFGHRDDTDPLTSNSRYDSMS